MDYSKKIFEILDRDRADLRRVEIKLPKETIELYFKPFTSTQHRDCIARATKTKEIKEINSDTIREEKYICEYTYISAIIYYQALDKDGNRIFNSLLDIDRIRDKMPYTKMSYLASIMGADIEQEIRDITNG